MEQNDTAPPAERVLGVVRDLSFCRTLEHVMDIVRREARELTAADGVTFVLREQDRCYYAEENAIAPLWKGRRFPMSACISGWVMRNRQVVAIDDIYADPRIPQDAYRPTFVQSLAMVPIRASDPLGAIGAYWATHHRASAAEMSVLQAIADACALALENVQLYESLQAAVRRAEALNRAKDEWISVVSHELRTPLTPILGWTKILRSSQLAADRQQHALEVIERNVAEEIRIVNDLLDVSRLMIGKVRVEPEPLDLAVVLEPAIERARTSASAKGVEFAASMPSRALFVQGDPERLRQAVSNLAGNAIKFTPAGGQVTIGVEESDGQVSIVVSDTGAGVAADVLPKLFDRFERGDSSMNRSGSGLGLGLFLVRRIAELHGGSVSAYSDGPNRGSMFVLHLPLGQPPRATTPPAVRVPEKDLKGLRILVVDDEPDAVDLLQHALEACGAHVVGATSADQAEDACRVSPPFDAVISDLAMPRRNGFQLLATIRSFPAPLGEVPVLALTAHANVDDARRAHDAGFQEYLAKPIDPIRVAEALRTAVDRHTAGASGARL